MHPIPLIVAGVRMNVSLGKLYKEPEPGEEYDFIPNVNLRNNLFQFSMEYPDLFRLLKSFVTSMDSGRYSALKESGLSAK